MKSKKSLDKSKSSKSKKDKSLDKSKGSKKSSKSKSKDSKDKSKDKSKEKSKDKKSEKDTQKKETAENKKEEIIINENNLPDNQSLSGIHKDNLDGFDFTNIQDINKRQEFSSPFSTALPPSKSRRCEGCFQNEGILYCDECNKILCSLCDGQIHMIPVNSSHNKVPINEIGNMKRLCYHHGEPLSLYCGSCEEVICNQCQVIGPHNTSFHRIIKIGEAFEKKFAKLMNLKPSLLKKLSELSVHNNKIGELIEKLNQAKTELVRDIRSQYSELSQKVKNVEGKREAVLGYETMELQNDINAINDNRNFISDIQENKDSDIINFLVQYYQLDAKMDAIIDKTIKDKINSNELEKYPNELEERHKTIEDFDKVQKMIEEKNEEIKKVIKEKKERESHLILEAKEAAAKDIQNWVNKSNKLEEELKKYKVVCAFCGKYLDKNVINKDCTANANFCLNFYFTKECPNKDILNTKRHFFGEPIENSSEKMRTAELMWREQQEEIKRQMIFNQMKKKEEEEKIKMQKQSTLNINATNSMNKTNDNIVIHVTTDNNPVNISQVSNKDLLSATNGFNTSIKFDKNNQKVNLNILTDSQPNVIQSQDD